jgi:hypothetical protein
MALPQPPCRIQVTLLRWTQYALALDESLEDGRHRRLNMASRTLVCSGLFPAATTRHAIWRSVIRPIGFKFSPVSTTTISPQSCVTITSAACCTLCSGVQQGKLAFMRSLACIMDLLVRIATFLIPFNRNSHFERLWRVTRQAEYTIRELLIKARIVGG